MTNKMDDFYTRACKFDILAMRLVKACNTDETADEVKRLFEIMQPKFHTTVDGFAKELGKSLWQMLQKSYISDDDYHKIVVEVAKAAMHARVH